MHVVMVARDGSKATVARAFDLPLSFGKITCGAWRESPAAATWGYNTFRVVPWMSLEAWKRYQKMAIVYTRSEVLVGSDQHRATINLRHFSVPLRSTSCSQSTWEVLVQYKSICRVILEKKRKLCVCEPTHKAKVECTGVVPGQRVWKQAPTSYGWRTRRNSAWGTYHTSIQPRCKLKKQPQNNP